MTKSQLKFSSASYYFINENDLYSLDFKPILLPRDKLNGQYYNIQVFKNQKLIAEKESKQYVNRDNAAQFICDLINSLQLINQ